MASTTDTPGHSGSSPSGWAAEAGAGVRDGVVKSGLSTHDVALLRLAAQRLVGREADPVAAVSHLGALQAQELNGGIASVALRTTSHDAGAVRAAFDGGLLVRTWPLRGTLHIVTAADLGWILVLTSARTRNAAAQRRRALELDDGVIDRARAVARENVAGGAGIGRDALVAAWTDAGVATLPQHGYHLLFHLGVEGTLCMGPMDGSEQLVVAVPHDADAIDPEAAAAEMVRRYLRSHGPASVADLLRWSGADPRPLRAALAHIRRELLVVDCEGCELFMDSAAPGLLEEHRAAAQGLLLLPGFDELILGYADRTCTVSAEHGGRICPGANGMFRATVVWDGRVVATWAWVGSGRRRRRVATPFAPLGRTVVAALDAAGVEVAATP